MYYTVLGREVMLWQSPAAKDCILGTGPGIVVERLRSLSETGHAQLLVERLPAPAPLSPLPPGQIIFDRKVLVRGVPIEPQCESSKDLYWIVDFRFLEPYRWPVN